VYQFAFLSDALRTNSILANAWTLSFFPSLTMILCSLYSYFKWHGMHTQVTLTFISAFVTHLGLFLVIFFDNRQHNSQHLIGVAAAVGGILFMYIMVIHSDWEILRQTWHPNIVFDSILAIFAAVSVVVLAVTIGADHRDWVENPITVQVSVISEWVLLVILMVMQLTLPSRAVRIALFVAEATKFPQEISDGKEYEN